MQTVAIKKNLIQYFFVFEWFAVQAIAIKKNLIQYVLYLNGRSANCCNQEKSCSVFFCI